MRPSVQKFVESETRALRLESKTLNERIARLRRDIAEMRRRVGRKEAKVRT